MSIRSWFSTTFSKFSTHIHHFLEHLKLQNWLITYETMTMSLENASELYFLFYNEEDSVQRTSFCGHSYSFSFRTSFNGIFLKKFLVNVDNCVLYLIRTLNHVKIGFMRKNGDFTCSSMYFQCKKWFNLQDNRFWLRKRQTFSRNRRADLPENRGVPLVDASGRGQKSTEFHLVSSISGKFSHSDWAGIGFFLRDTHTQTQFILPNIIFTLIIEHWIKVSFDTCFLL